MGHKVEMTPAKRKLYRRAHRPRLGLREAMRECKRRWAYGIALLIRTSDDGPWQRVVGTMEDSFELVIFGRGPSWEAAFAQAKEREH